MASSQPSSPELAVKLRSYQQEMLDASLLRNIIVAMDTGSGKTHVAVARIAAELERTRGKLVAFLAPAVALVHQQARALSAGLPAAHIKSLTGQDGVEKWTDQRLWDAVLTNVDVLICTPAVLLDALSHGFVTMNCLSLCVFDEAHHATKGHPMNAIMQLFYHPAMQKPSSVPYVLGLTASPVLNSKKGSLEIIERNLNAIAVTPKHHRAEMETYVSPPDVITVVYTCHTRSGSQRDPLCSALTHEAQSYDFHNDPYVLDLLENPEPWSYMKYSQTIAKQKTYCSEQLRALDVRACSIEQQFGTSIAAWYVRRCIAAFEQSLVSSNLVMPDLTEKEKERLRIILSRVQKATPLCSDTLEIADTAGLTRKASELIAILEQYATTRPTAIIFVEQRVHTTALAQLLRQIPAIRTAYKIGQFVGTSTSSKRKVSVADLVEIEQQQKYLDAFRSGETNLMIATNVLEEGIDVSACNLVICFDPPKNLVSFIQRRGRARQRNSKYFMFVQEDDYKQHGKKWALLEAQMKQAYMDDTRQLADYLDDELDLEFEPYQVESTGALLTLENAKSHLYHFCSMTTLQVSKYVDLRPEFDTQQDFYTKLWTASVTLPSSVHSNIRNAVSSKLWKNEGMAIKDAAFQAYVSLHKAGLVNDNLLPLVKDYGPDTGQQHLDQPSLIQVSDRQSSWRALWEAQDLIHPVWSNYTVTIELSSVFRVTMSMLLPLSELPDMMFDLYWNANTAYTASVQRAKNCLNSIDDSTRSLLQRSTALVMRSVHGNRMPSMQQDFAILLSPAENDLVEDWLAKSKGAQPAVKLTGLENLSCETGLVRLNGQDGLSYFYHGLESLESESELQIWTTLFPKRRDFLHPVAEDATRAAAYTAKQNFDARDCSVDNLPSKYAQFAAFLPSILHCTDVALLVTHLKTSVLSSVDFEHKSLLHEAISSPAAGELTDYNRLEYLGDTILKHCTELQVMSQHTTWPEAYLSVERDRIVRNSNLSRAALDAGLDKYILTKPFTGSKWRPIYISQILAEEQSQREMSTKTLADVVEALIGAAFIDGGMYKAQKCIETLLPQETWHGPAQCFDTLIDELRPTKYQNLDLLERLVGHEFRYPTLLVEAITHASYPHIQTGLSYERLEFLGDSVLDMVITPKLFAHSRNLRHWELHRVHEALVNSHFLGFCCLKYAIEEEQFDVVEQPTGGHDIHRSTRLIHLHDFLRAGHGLTPLRRKCVATFEGLRERIDTALANGKEYPWPDLVALSPPKFFCDLVESVLGALYIDTRGDLTKCEAFVEKLGILTHMRRILDEHVETTSPKERLGAVADRDVVRYVNHRSEGDDGKRTFSCTVKVGKKEVVTVDGCDSKDEAEVKAAYQACVLLGDRVGDATGRKKRKLQTAKRSADEENRIGDGDEDGEELMS